MCCIVNKTNTQKNKGEGNIDQIIFIWIFHKNKCFITTIQRPKLSSEEKKQSFILLLFNLYEKAYLSNFKTSNIKSTKLYFFHNQNFPC